MADIEARQKARAIVQRRGLGALGNDTKWGEFFARIIAEAIPVEIKLINEEQPYKCGTVCTPSGNYIEGGGGMGPVLFVFIEWVRSPSTEEVKAAAMEIGLECEVHNGAAIVYGYR